MENPITLIPIGYVKNSREGMKDDYWGSVISEITISDELPEECLDGIDTFSHLEIIFYFDKAAKTDVVHGASHPRGNKEWPKVGIFAQRKKDRPNHLGLTVVKVISRNGRTLTVQVWMPIMILLSLISNPWQRNFSQGKKSPSPPG